MLDYNNDTKPTQAENAVQEIDTSSALASFLKFREVLSKMTAQVEAIAVTDEETLAQASEMANQARKIKNEISKRLKDVTRKYVEAKKNVEGKVKGLLLFKFEDLERMADGKCRPYLLKKEEERRAAERKAQEAAEKARREAEEAEKKKAQENSAEQAQEPEKDPTPPPAPIIPEVVDDKTEVKTDSGSVTIEHEYVPELEDPRAISDECVKARWKQLEGALLPYARARIKMGDTAVPGFRITKEAKVKRRVR